MTNVLYDNINLTNSPYNVKSISHEEATPREVESLNLARQRGSIIVNTEYRPKKIVLTGIITGTSVADLETNIDTFKELLSREASDLDLDYAGGTRRYRCTATNIEIDREYWNLTYAPYTAEFIVSEGIGKDVSDTIATLDNITTLNSVNTTTIEGTASPLPTITITFEPTTSSVTGLSFSLNGNTITLTNALVENDVVVIDFYNKKITLNGTEMDYTGIFPVWEIGTNRYTVSVAGGDSQYDLDITYKKYYL